MTDKIINDKLDLILSKLEALEKASGKKDVLKDEFREYMLSHFNISWISDDIEGDVYDTLFTFVEELLLRR